MLYLVRTTLQYSRRSDLSWDPTADLVFLCERCPSDIASIRHQLNKQDLEDCLFRTPFFSSLPVETRRICSQVLLGIDCSLKPSKTAGIQETVPNSAPNHSRQLNARQLRHNSGNANGGSRGHSPGMKRQSLGPMARPVSFQTFLQQQTQHQKSSSPAPLKRKPVRGHLPNALVSSTSNAPPIANTQRLPIFIPEPLPNSNNKLLPVPDPKSLPTANNQPLPIYNHLPFASQKSNLSAGLGSGYAAFTVNRPQVSHRYSQPPPSEYTAYNAPSPLTIFTGASIPPPHRLPKPHPPRLFIQTAFWVGPRD
ncbi:hypothetical protein GQ43DRAFT_437005 [Delitschia confertaspora ATCC 74209]|uniref:Uncharacterized protein n=1 Tax=Delitschia confertaspora ATCC 74209 TaxID=1513339 RepID=A0A9P4JZQ4_9PLEO|nr:hypothetical protein GQ43DRAFT_437005 [Delitschia confertaspora ATCC 74209]